MIVINMTAIDKFRQFYQHLNEKDLSGLKEVYADDVEFIDPIATHTGLESVSNYFSDLFKNTHSCFFDITTISSIDTENHVVEWQMNFISNKLSKHKQIKVDGVTLLRTRGSLVTYHRDYYDMGQLVYENIPLLGRLIKKIKENMQ